MYFHATDHDIEYYPTLMKRIHEKMDLNNQNVQWIVEETREDDGKKINIVTRGGTKIGEDVGKKNQNQNQWVMMIMIVG